MDFTIPEFDLKRGLMALVPGALVRGIFVAHDAAEYSALEWMDPRTKPAYAEVEAAALDDMRNRWRTAINDKTNYMIQTGFTFTDYEGTLIPFKLTIIEQFNMLNIWLLRSSLTYPYKFKADDDTHGQGIYIMYQSADEIHNCYMSGFAFIDANIASGRQIKDTLGAMNRSELEALRDTR